MIRFKDFIEIESLILKEGLISDVAKDMGYSSGIKGLDKFVADQSEKGGGVIDKILTKLPAVGPLAKIKKDAMERVKTRKTEKKDIKNYLDAVKLEEKSSQYRNKEIANLTLKGDYETAVKNLTPAEYKSKLETAMGLKEKVINELNKDISKYEFGGEKLKQYTDKINELDKTIRQNVFVFNGTKDEEKKKKYADIIDASRKERDENGKNVLEIYKKIKKDIDEKTDKVSSEKKYKSLAIFLDLKDITGYIDAITRQMTEIEMMTTQSEIKKIILSFINELPNENLKNLFQNYADTDPTQYARQNSISNQIHAQIKKLKLQSEIRTIIDDLEDKKEKVSPNNVSSIQAYASVIETLQRVTEELHAMSLQEIQEKFVDSMTKDNYINNLRLLQKQLPFTAKSFSEDTEATKVFPTIITSIIKNISTFLGKKKFENIPDINRKKELALELIKMAEILSKSPTWGKLYADAIKNFIGIDDLRRFINDNKLQKQVASKTPLVSAEDKTIQSILKKESAKATDKAKVILNLPNVSIEKKINAVSNLDTPAKNKQQFYNVLLKDIKDPVVKKQFSDWINSQYKKESFVFSDLYEANEEKKEDKKEEVAPEDIQPEEGSESKNVGKFDLEKEKEFVINFLKKYKDKYDSMKDSEKAEFDLMKEYAKELVKKQRGEVSSTEPTEETPKKKKKEKKEPSVEEPEEETKEPKKTEKPKEENNETV